jgi:hypothetical protein
MAAFLIERCPRPTRRMRATHDGQFGPARLRSSMRQQASALRPQPARTTTNNTKVIVRATWHQWWPASRHRLGPFNT